MHSIVVHLVGVLWWCIL